MQKLNLGCGSQVNSGWINVDYSFGAKMAKLPLFSRINKIFGFFKTDWDNRILIHDLTTQFPWTDNSIDEIFSSHTLEHLTRDEGEFFLNECFRVLKKGGVIRIVVPDLSAIVAQYLRGDLRADNFVERLGVLYNEPNRLMKFMTPYVSFPHKCMYDKSTLLSAFKLAGFDAHLAEPFQSLIADINAIEDSSRTVDAVIVEGIKS